MYPVLSVANGNPLFTPWGHFWVAVALWGMLLIPALKCLCLKAFVSISYFNYESIDVRLAADVYIYYKLRLTLCGVTKHWSYFSNRLLFLSLLCEIDL